MSLDTRQPPLWNEAPEERPILCDSCRFEEVEEEGDVCPDCNDAPEVA